MYCKTVELKDWKLKGYYPYEPLLNKSVETSTHLKGVIDFIDAEVPGSIYKDLMNAKVIDFDIYKDLNSLKCEWVSQRWWLYRTSFTTEKEFKRLELVFEGIDYKATVYLNGRTVARHEGMFLPCVIDITDIVRRGEENRLEVIIEHAPDEMGQIGYTEKVRTQKSRYNYKWDFSARLINLGLYKPVRLKYYGDFKIESKYFKTIDESKGIAGLEVEIHSKKCARACVSYDLKFEGKTVSSQRREVALRKGLNKVKFRLNCPDAKLWYPQNAGGQNLYDLRFEVSQGEDVSDFFDIRVGFKRITLERNENSPKGALSYIFRVNGKRVYIKGANITPLDVLSGTVGNERYERLVKLAKKANINLFRIWGGGLIESEYLYSLCDEAGIMIWQEFIQSSSGLSNVPSKDKHYLKLLKKGAEQAVKEKRNHACLCAYSGGNELTDEKGAPITFKDRNITMLKRVVKKLDGVIPMFPSSGSGPSGFASLEHMGKNHDVHGPWKYLGTEEHYRFYNNIDSLFHSEFGTDGMTSVSSMRRFLSEEHIKVTDMDENIVWRHHGEWWDTYHRDKAIFGEFEALEDFVAASQFIQAEAIRYSLEANRRRAFANSGSIVWQLNESFPNVSCTSLVDYFLQPKPALHFAGKAFSSLNMSVAYDKLVYGAGDTLSLRFFVTYDFAPEPVEWRYAVHVDGALAAEKQGKATCGDGYTQKVDELTYKLGQGKGITVTLWARSLKASFENKVLLFVKDEDGRCDVRLAKAFLAEVGNEEI